MDQYSRRIREWSLARRRTSAVTCALLALAARRPPPHGVIFHNERGSEYMGASFCARVLQYGTLQSANVSGSGDNAHAESWFHTLKAELTRGVIDPTEQVLRAELQCYIRYYITVRSHSSLDYCAPLASSGEWRNT